MLLGGFRSFTATSIPSLCKTKQRALRTLQKIFSEIEFLYKNIFNAEKALEQLEEQNFSSVHDNIYHQFSSFWCLH